MLTAARIQSMEKSLRKLRPTNCSRTREYVAKQDLKWRSGSPVRTGMRATSTHFSGKFSPHKSRDITPRDPGKSLTKTLCDFPPRNATAASTDPQMWDFTPASLNEITSPVAGDQSMQESRAFTRPFAVRFTTVKSTSRDPPRKPLSPNSSENCSRLSELISYCSRPTTVSENRLRKRSPKLSVSFQDLQDCLEATVSRKDCEAGSVTKTLRAIRRKKREEARNVMDKATIRTFLNQKREVSNFIITKFRRVRVWKHAGAIVPKKLEESLHQYWADLKS